MNPPVILLARAVAFFETAELTPRTTIFPPDAVREILKQFQFQKYPKNFEEWTADKGAEFLIGKYRDLVIDKLLIWQTGITVETKAGTTESRRFLEEILLWAKSTLGIAYEPDMIKHWAYVSSMVVHSDVPILSTSPVERLAEKISSELGGILGEPIQYLPAGMAIAHDPLARKTGRAIFTISRRADTPYSENKYFSEAPLPTEVHFRLLEEFEA